MTYSANTHSNSYQREYEWAELVFPLPPNPHVLIGEEASECLKSFRFSLEIDIQATSEINLKVTLRTLNHRNKLYFTLLN